MEFWLQDKQCTGCGACTNACSHSAISMMANSVGFLFPRIDANLCMECGRCKNVCPILRKRVAADDAIKLKVYAAWSKDADNRYHSTSGGVFTELARHTLSIGGVVAGAVYRDDQMVAHQVVTDEEGLDRVRQSKYVQSDSGTVYRDTKIWLDSGKHVLFCGCPCQVAGLKTFLAKSYDNLYTCDFICRGANSPKAYRKWLDYLEEKYHAKATRVWFKNKELGWNRFCTRVDFENGKVYREDRYHDLYMKGYLERNLYIRPSCADCRFKGFPRFGDLTLADFWGVSKKLDEDKGTSLVFVNTQRGQSLLDAISGSVENTERAIEETLAGNPMLEKSVWISKQSEAFLDNLDEDRFDVAYRKMDKKLYTATRQAKIDKKRKERLQRQQEKKKQKAQNARQRKSLLPFITKLMEYRFLFEELVRRDFKKKYNRTYLGMLWSLLSPLLSLLVMSIIFTQFFGQKMEHYTIYLFSGNLIFSYFKEATMGGMSALSSNASIFSKVNVPKYMFVASKNVSCFYNFLLTLVIYFIFVAFSGLPFSVRFFSLLYPIMCLLVFNIGMGLILSALEVFFKDTRYFYDIATLLLMYMSAIFYSVDNYPAFYQRLFLLNPIYVYIKYFRTVVIDGNIPSLPFHGIALLYALGAIGLGSLIYKKNNQRFLYYI